MKLSEEWSSPDYQVSPEDVNCTGCNIGSETVLKFVKNVKYVCAELKEE